MKEIISSRRRFMSSFAALGLAGIPSLVRAGNDLPSCFESMDVGPWHIGIHADSIVAKSMLSIPELPDADITFGFNVNELGKVVSIYNIVDLQYMKYKEDFVVLCETLAKKYYPEFHNNDTNFFHMEIQLVSMVKNKKFSFRFMHKTRSSSVDGEDLKTLQYLIANNGLGLELVMYTAPKGMKLDCRNEGDNFKNTPACLSKNIFKMKKTTIKFIEKLETSQLNDLTIPLLKQRDVAKRKAENKCSDECFITTACCDVVGLSDDCWELKTLRKFRDEKLPSLPGGKEDIATYYNSAPLIIKKIFNKPNGEKQFVKLYWKYIIPCVVMAKLNLNQMCYSHYKKMMLSLSKI